MKSNKLLAVAACCAMVLISVSCGKEKSKVSEEQKTFEPPKASYGEKEITTTLAPIERTSKESVSDWPVADLSGDPDDSFTAEEHCYYEGDRYVIFIQKGVTVPGDTAKKIEYVMSSLEELFGMSFDYMDDPSDNNWRYLYFDKEFEDVNPDCSKVNVLITKNPHDGRVNWAMDTCAMLYEEDLQKDGSIYVAYHELAHVLQLRNAHELGQVFHEGVAEYAEWYFAQKENYRDDSLDVFSRDEDGMLSYDESEMLKDAEAAFVFENETSSGIFQRHYQYGFRFVSFLVDTYGIEVIKDICDMSLQFTFDYTRTDMIIRVLKEATSEDVFERFEKWLPEGWDQYTEECREYMRQFEEVPVSPTER